MTYSRGIALFQVLIMTTIMSLIAIGLNYAARSNVETAKLFQDRLQAELTMRSARSRVYYELFKNDPSDLSDKVQRGVKWNLRGQPIQPDSKTKIKIQAVVGLFSIASMSEDYMRSLLTNLEVNESTQSIIINSINDWQDSDSDMRFGGAEDNFYAQTDAKYSRNGVMQHMSELRYIRGMDDALYQKLTPLLTTYLTPWFNPALAPPILVRSVFSEDNTELIVQLQNKQAFTWQAWQNIVGQKELQNVDTHPGSIFMVELEVVEGEVRLLKKFDIKVQTEKANSPLIILRVY
jgi:general secretion pathway protein K